MRMIGLAYTAAFALGVMACGPAAAEGGGVVAQDGIYPAPEYVTTEGGGKVFDGWVHAGDHEWIANPDDPASPRYLKIPRTTDDPVDALREITSRAGIEISDVATREIETWTMISGGKGYATAASATVGGVAHSVFVTTVHHSEGQYDTDLHSIPTASYRAWGGVMFYLDLMEVTNGDEGLPEGFREEARDASNADQAQVFAGLIDVKMTRLAIMAQQAQMGAYSSVLSTMRQHGQQMQDSANCYMLSYCNYDWMTGQTDYNGD